MVPIATATQLDFTFMLSKFNLSGDAKYFLWTKKNYGKYRDYGPDSSGLQMYQILTPIYANTLTSKLYIHLYWF